MNKNNTTTTPTIVAILIAATLLVGATFAATITTPSMAFAGGKKEVKQDRYMMKGPQDSYKKGAQDKQARANGKDDGSGNGNSNTVTIQENKQGVNNVPNILTGGALGSQEPEGGSGEQGPNQQLRVREVLGQTTVLPPGTSTILSAVCGAGEVATGGGVSVVNQPPTSVSNELNHAFWIEHSIQGRGWMFTIQNPGPDPIRLEVYAECLSLVDVP
jgi:hypothetical protein